LIIGFLCKDAKNAEILKVSSKRFHHIEHRDEIKGRAEIFHPAQAVCFIVKKGFDENNLLLLS
jgi:hypothetical protein